MAGDTAGRHTSEFRTTRTGTTLNPEAEQSNLVVT